MNGPRYNLTINRQCFFAVIPAQRSIHAMIPPPKAVPTGLVCDGSSTSFMAAERSGTHIGRAAQRMSQPIDTVRKRDSVETGDGGR